MFDYNQLDLRSTVFIPIDLGSSHSKKRRPRRGSKPFVIYNEKDLLNNEGNNDTGSSTEGEINFFPETTRFSDNESSVDKDGENNMSIETLSEGDFSPEISRVMNGFDKKDSPLSELSLDVTQRCNINDGSSTKSFEINNLSNEHKLTNLSVRRSLSFEDKENILNQSIPLSKSVDEFLKCKSGINISILSKTVKYPEDEFSNINCYNLSLSSDNVKQTKDDDLKSPPKKNRRHLAQEN